jgi:DNA invertase Pin-like site-specific DNA recombinase
MPLYGYARVSTLDQDLSIQRAALKAAGCEVIRAEKVSGARRDGRTELQVLLDFLREGVNGHRSFRRSGHLKFPVWAVVLLINDQPRG